MSRFSPSDKANLFSLLAFMGFGVIQGVNIVIGKVDSSILTISWFLLGIGFFLLALGIIAKRL